MDRTPSGWTGFKTDLQHYFERFQARSLGRKLAVLTGERGLWALANYRFGRWLWSKPRPFNPPLKLVYYAGEFAVRRLARVQLSPTTRLGASVYLPSKRTVIFNGEAVVNDGCTFFGENTLGVSGRGEARGAPTLERDCVLAPGATVVGKVQLPRGTSVGPNAFVSKTPLVATALMGTPATPSPRKLHGVPDSSYRREEETTIEAISSEPFWEHYRQDLDRVFIYFDRPSLGLKLREALTNEGLWALAVYRAGRKLRPLRRRSFGRIAWAAFRMAESWVRGSTGIHLDVDADIAPGFYIGHFGPIFVGRGTRIGRSCNIGQMCWLGAEHGGEAPTVGERVYIGVGAKIIGAITVGSDAAIGANSAVFENIESGCVAAGNPARVVNRKGSGDFIQLTRPSQKPMDRSGPNVLLETRGVPERRNEGSPGEVIAPGAPSSVEQQPNR